jgi:hypothetical protein
MTQQEINQLSFWEKQVIKVYNTKKSHNEFFFIDKLTPNVFRLIELKPDLSEKIREVELTPNDTDFNLRLNTLEAKMKRGEAEVLFGEGDTWAGIVRKKSVTYVINGMRQWAFVYYVDFYNNNKKSKKSSKDFYDLIFDKKIKLVTRENSSIQNAVNTPTSTTTSTPTPTPTPTTQPVNQSPFQDFIDNLGFSNNCILKSNLDNFVTIIDENAIHYGDSVQDFKFFRKTFEVINGEIKRSINDDSFGIIAEGNLEGTAIALEKNEYEILIEKGDFIVESDGTRWRLRYIDEGLGFLREGTTNGWLMPYDEFFDRLERKSITIEKGTNIQVGVTSQPAKQYGFKKGSVLVTTKNPLEYFAVLEVDFNSGMITMESGDVSKNGDGIRIIEEARTTPFGYMYLLQEAIDKGEYKLLYNIGDEFKVKSTNSKIEITNVIEKKTLFNWNNYPEELETWKLIEVIEITKKIEAVGSSTNATTTAANQPIEVKVGQFYKNSVGNYYYIYATLDGNVTEVVFGKDFTRKEKYYIKQSSDEIKNWVKNGEWIFENPPNVPYNLGDKFYLKSEPSDVFTINFKYTNDEDDDSSSQKKLKVEIIDNSLGEVDNLLDLDVFKEIIDSGDIIFIKEEKAPPKEVAPAIIYSSDEIRYKELKKELEQILFLKSTINDMNFEERINVDTLYEDVKNEADALFFKITEDKLGQNEIIDTMFEQSFMPLERRYDLGETNITGDNFAPNGTPSEIPESIYHITKTKDFIEWFGDYKEAYRLRNVKNAFVDCSKVLTENYEPQLVWHGSGHLFSYFLFDRFPAAYFAVNKSYAEWFANRDATRQGGYLYPFFLDIRRPLDLTLFGVDRIKGQEFLDWIYLQTGLERKDLKLNPMLLRPTAPELWAWSYLRNSPDFLAQIRDTNVFDGIIYYENNPDDIINRQENVTKAYIIFKPEQCKLAIPDRGALLQASLKSFVLKKGGKI